MHAADLHVKCTLFFPILTVNSSFTAFMEFRLSVLELGAYKRPYTEPSRDANAPKITVIRTEIRTINPRVRRFGHCHRHQVFWLIEWRRMRWTDRYRA
jgi:hypothetical protein